MESEFHKYSVVYPALDKLVRSVVSGYYPTSKGVHLGTDFYLDGSDEWAFSVALTTHNLRVKGKFRAASNQFEGTVNATSGKLERFYIRQGFDILSDLAIAIRGFKDGAKPSYNLSRDSWPC